MVMVCDKCENKEGVKSISVRLFVPSAQPFAQEIVFTGDLCRKCRRKLFRDLDGFGGLECGFNSYNGRTPYDNRGN